MRDSFPCSSLGQLGFHCFVFWRSASGLWVHLLGLKCCCPSSCSTLSDLSMTERQQGKRRTGGSHSSFGDGKERDHAQASPCSWRRVVWSGTCAYICPLGWCGISLGSSGQVSDSLGEMACWKGLHRSSWCCFCTWCWSGYTLTRGDSIDGAACSAVASRERPGGRAVGESWQMNALQHAALQPGRRRRQERLVPTEKKELHCFSPLPRGKQQKISEWFSRERGS